jgi:hypothetical protein
MQAIDRHLARTCDAAHAAADTAGASVPAPAGVLEGGDFDAIAVARRLMPQLLQQHPTVAHQIESAMSVFDFERALSAL